jgi:hypothetical protein
MNISLRVVPHFSFHLFGFWHSSPALQRASAVEGGPSAGNAVIKRRG